MLDTNWSVAIDHMTDVNIVGLHCPLVHWSVTIDDTIDVSLVGYSVFLYTGL